MLVQVVAVQIEEVHVPLPGVVQSASVVHVVVLVSITQIPDSQDNGEVQSLSEAHDRPEQ